MVNIMDTKCITCNLKVHSFNYPNEEKTLYCNECKNSCMVDIKHKKCITCNKTRANLDYKDEEKGLYCASCKLVWLILKVNASLVI